MASAPVANEAGSSPQPLIDQQHRDAHNRGERERQPSNFERRHGFGLKTSVQENTARFFTTPSLLTG
jgi:hypothetical protein